MSGGGCGKPGERSELIAGNEKKKGEFALLHGDKLMCTHTHEELIVFVTVYCLVFQKTKHLM